MLNARPHVAELDHTGLRAARREGRIEWRQHVLQSLAERGVKQHHVIDAARLIGAFDNGGTLRHWNLHAGGPDPMGRIDYWIEEGTYDQLVIDDDSLEARLRDEAYAMTRQSAWEALGGGSGNVPVAIQITASAMPAAEDTLVVFIDAALAAAEPVGLSMKALAASTEFYTASVTPLQGVLIAAFLSEGYSSAEPAKAACSNSKVVR